MDIASVLRIISYIGYIFFAIFTVLTVTIFIKYDIRNVFGFLSGHVAAKRIAEMEHASGGTGNYSQSRVKSNSLFRKNTGKNDSTNRLKTDHLVKNSNSQLTEKLEKKSFVHSDISGKDTAETEPLEQRTEPLLQEKTEPLEPLTEVLGQEETEPLVWQTEVLHQESSERSSDVGEDASLAGTVLLNDSVSSSDAERSVGANRDESAFKTEVLSESRGAEESFTEVLGVDVETLSDLSQNDILSELEMHKTIHKEVAPGFVVEKEIVLTHSADRISGS